MKRLLFVSGLVICGISCIVEPATTVEDPVTIATQSTELERDLNFAACPATEQCLCSPEEQIALSRFGAQCGPNKFCCAPPPPTPPPPPPPVDTTGSYLNMSARSYLAQVGVPDATSVGGVQWVNACKVSANQGAGTFNSGITNSCSWANLQPGWIVLEVNYEVLRNDHGRGSASVSSVNGSVTISTSEFGSKFNGAMDVAISIGDISASQKLQLEYQRLNGYSFMFDGVGNNVVATVKANGGLFQGSRIEIQATAKLLRVY